MTDQKQAPEQRDLKDICFTLRQTSLHRAAEIIESLAKQRDELAAENASLITARDMMGRLLSNAIAEREEARSASAVREIAMRDRAAERIESLGFSAGLIRALPLSPDGQQALNEILADAWVDGMWAGLGEDGPVFDKNPHRKGAT